MGILIRSAQRSQEVAERGENEEGCGRDRILKQVSGHQQRKPSFWDFAGRRKWRAEEELIGLKWSAAEAYGLLNRNPGMMPLGFWERQYEFFSGELGRAGKLAVECGILGSPYYSSCVGVVDGLKGEIDSYIKQRAIEERKSRGS